MSGALLINPIDFLF